MRPKANLVVLDPGSGKARPGAWVTLYHANTLTKASLYADDDASPIANPVQANGLGQVAVRLNAGLYDVSMTWDGALPTVVEDVSLVSSEQIIASPGDIVIGDVDGSPIRLAVGANGQTLVVEDGLPKWVTLGSGHGLPVGANGSLLSYGPTGAVLPILPGLQDQALAMQGGRPEWVSTLLPPGTTLPINQPGDLVVGQVTTGAVARLARGATDDVLRVADTGGLVWGATDTIGRGGVQGYLAMVYESPGNRITFQGWKGTQCWIDGRARRIPAEGVSLLPTGLTVDTTYFIYAAWVAGAMVMEASTTGWELTDGLPHKAGDQSRTLLGMAHVKPGPAFVSDSSRQLLLRLHAGLDGVARGDFSANRAVASPTFAEVHSEIRIEFLSWPWHTTSLSLEGVMYLSHVGMSVDHCIVLDGAMVGGTGYLCTTDGEWKNISTSFISPMGQGYHMATFHARVFSGPPGSTITYQGDPSDIQATRLTALIAGAG